MRNTLANRLREAIQTLRVRKDSHGNTDIFKKTFPEGHSGREALRGLLNMLKHAQYLPDQIEIEMLRFAHIIAKGLHALLLPMACVKNWTMGDHPTHLEAMIATAAMTLDKETKELLGELFWTLRTHKLSEAQKQRISFLVAGMDLEKFEKSIQPYLKTVQRSHQEIQEWLAAQYFVDAA